MNKNTYYPHAQEAINYALDYSLETDYLLTNQYNNLTFDQIVTQFRNYISDINTFCEIKVVEIRCKDATMSFCFHNDICCQAFIFFDDIDSPPNNIQCHSIDTCTC